MSTFTKGPYRVARSDDECTEEWSLDGPGSYAYLPIVSGTKLIACVRGDLIDESFETAPEMEATANLIAAAPDMFEALSRWVDLAETAIRELGIEPHPDERKCLDLARGALAKARATPVSDPAPTGQGGGA